MYILHLCPVDMYPIKSGGQRKRWNLLMGLSQEREKTICFIIKKKNENAIPNLKNIEFYPLFPPFKYKYFYFNLIFVIRKICKTKKIQYVIIDQPFLGLIAWMIKKIFSIPFIIHSHNIEYQRFRSLKKMIWIPLRIYEKWVFQQANHIFMVSKKEKNWVREHWRIDEKKLSILYYFVPKNEIKILNSEEKTHIKKNVGVKDNMKTLFFFGSLNYAPNIEAVHIILDKIIPYLEDTPFLFKVYIAGDRISEKLYNKIQLNKRVKYLGFIENIFDYLQVMDIMLNPILSGGGIKTKVIEALTMNISVVSTESGAVSIESAEEKLFVSPDKDWKKFTENIKTALQKKKNTPESFFQKYSFESNSKAIQKAFKRV